LGKMVEIEIESLPETTTNSGTVDAFLEYLLSQTEKKGDKIVVKHFTTRDVIEALKITGKSAQQKAFRLINVRCGKFVTVHKNGKKNYYVANVENPTVRTMLLNKYRLQPEQKPAK
jgi:hypothetical protein